MQLGSKFVYLGNAAEDEEEVVECNGVVLSDDESDDNEDDGEECRLSILDTVGHEEYSSARDIYLHTADAFVVIYSISDDYSFREAEAIFNWLVRLRQTIPYAILVANKCDLVSEDSVVSLEGHALAERLAIPFYETSAMTGDGVTEAMTGLIKLIPRTSKNYKIVMLGSGAVGKSSITFRFIKDTFQKYYPSVEKSYHRIIKVQGLQKITKKKSSHTKTEEIATQESGSKRDRKALRKLFSFFKLKGSRKKKNPPGAPSSRDTETSSPPETASETRVKIKEKKIDANVALIRLRILDEKPHLVTGDPITCAQCMAVLTMTADLREEEDATHWICEFCGHINPDLDISEDEVCMNNRIDFLLMPPQTPLEKEDNAAEDVNKKKVATSGVIVYCMDVSGSMENLCKVPESYAAWQEVSTDGEEDVSQVTRLICIKEAIQRQIEQMKEQDPTKQVLIVAFDINVCVVGGGRTWDFPVFQQLERTSFHDLLQFGIELSEDYPLKSIAESFRSMSKAIASLESGRFTALGPALAICAGYVSNIPGSEIVLVTDGEPTVGVGDISVEGCYRDDFYKTIGEYARSKNITINILAVSDEYVQLRTVSKAAEISGGLTSLLNPFEMTRQLRVMTQYEVIATSVSVRVYLHPNFTFDEIGYGDNLSRLDKEVGNVRLDTELSFRFKLSGSNKYASQDLSYVPFQIQITYTLPDGMKCLRVLSKNAPTTTNRKEMEENINVSVITVAALRATAEMTKAGKALEAQHLLKNMKRLITRGAVTVQQQQAKLAYLSRMEGWDHSLTYDPESFSCEIDDTSYNLLLTALNANSSCSEEVGKKMEKDNRVELFSEEYKDDYYSDTDD